MTRIVAGPHYLVWPDQFPRYGVMVDLNVHERAFRFLRPADRRSWQQLCGLRLGTTILDPHRALRGELRAIVVRLDGSVIEGIEECRAYLMPAASYPVRFRPACGGLAESIERMVKFQCREDFDRHMQAYAQDVNDLIPDTITAESVIVEPYKDGPDERIGWMSTFVVRFPGWGVLGFTDGPV